MLKKQCIICKEEFDALTERKLYCSNACRKKAELIKRGKPVRRLFRTFVCENCGKEVSGVYNYNQIYCSDTCKKSACDKRYKARLKNTK